MIFGRRIEISCTLTLGSDMHIGVSNTGLDSDKHEVSLVARGVGERSIIPASSLKGVLRARLPEKVAKALFGDPSEQRANQGQAARLWLDHAWLITHPDALSGLSKETPVGGVFQAKHVALDPATGAAEEHKLFAREMVAAGATFSFRADWFPAEGDDITMLAPVFAMLRDGVQIGGGATKGHGQIKLETETLSLREYAPDTEGKLAEREKDATALCKAIDTVGDTTRTVRKLTLTLKAEGPFMSVREVDEDNRTNEMQPLEKDDKPVLWPESLAGALRSRARWLAALAADDGDHRDNPSTRRSREKLLEKLSDVERLFGVTGRKGALTVKSVVCEVPGEIVYLKNNSIDRFTGATRDAALYGKRAFWQPHFIVKLEVEGEHILLENLLKDLKSDAGGAGLELGHGSSIGFGWFKVEVSDD